MLSLVILAGGSSSRMGRDKGLLPLSGRPLVQHVLDRLSPIAEEILLSTNSPAEYAFLNLPILPDLRPGLGAIGGLWSALSSCKYPQVAAVACDMPFASRPLFEHELETLLGSGADAVVPSTPQGLEPLHAIYRREACLPAVQAAVEAGRYQMTAWLKGINALVLPPEVSLKFDPRGLAFWNLNTPAEFAQAEELFHHPG